MRALDIPPHSHSASRLAVTALGLIAAFGLTSGFLRAAADMTLQTQSMAAAGPAGLIPEATPAPEPSLQVAEAPPRRLHAAEPVDISDDVARPAADAVPAADASASEPDPAPPPAPSVAPTDPPAVDREASTGLPGGAPCSAAM